jgi:hypothetical protein
MCLITVLIGRLRMLLCRGRVLFALGVVALAVVFGSGPMRFGGVLVMLCSFARLVPWSFLLFAPSCDQAGHNANGSFRWWR